MSSNAIHASSNRIQRLLRVSRARVLQAAVVLLSLWGSSALAACVEQGGANTCTGQELNVSAWSYSHSNCYRAYNCDNSFGIAACGAAGGVQQLCTGCAGAVVTGANVVSVITAGVKAAEGACTVAPAPSAWGVTIAAGTCDNNAQSMSTAYAYGLEVQSYMSVPVSGTGKTNDPIPCSNGLSSTAAPHLNYAVRSRSVTPAAYPIGGPERTQDNCCAEGHPIRPGSGEKVFRELDFSSPNSPLRLERHYSSRGYYRPPGGNVATGTLGDYWRTNYDRRVIPVSNSTFVAVRALREDGRVKYFRADGSQVQHFSGTRAERLTSLPGGGWKYETNADETETYDAAGRLIQISSRGADRVTLTYDASSRLEKVVDQKGRWILFGYEDLADGTRVVRATTRSGAQYAYTLNTNAVLSRVGYPGGTQRRYLYNQVFPKAVELILDERSIALERVLYDTQGRAVSSNLAPEHFNDGVGRNSFVYNPDGTTTHTGPNGAVRVLGFNSGSGVINLASASAPCQGCANPAKSVTYDANGYTDLQTDFSNTVTDYDYDGSGRLLKLIRAKGKPEEQVETQIWNASLNVVTEVTRVGQKTSYTHNARGQVLTVTVTDTTVVPNRSRTTTTTYCEQAQVDAGQCPLVGLVLTQDGPRTDVSDIVSYTYYMDDPAGGDGSTCDEPGTTPCAYRKGDLQRVVNELGQATARFDLYDGDGRVLMWTGMNNVSHSYLYSPRGWVLEAWDYGSTRMDIPSDDLVTRYAYDAVGNVTRITSADGTWVDFNFDRANRLDRITDQLGNYVEFVLDNSGNQVSEFTKDPAGNLTRNITRVFDALGRMITQADAAGTPTDFRYDASGNVDQITDPLQRVATRSHDGLNRLRQAVGNSNGSGADRSVMGFDYDARSNLTAVIDPKGLQTTYAYDGFDELRQRTSPDSGQTQFTYDSGGNQATSTDQRGILAIYAHDAVGRLISQTVPTATQNVTFTYDMPQNDGGGNPYCSEGAVDGHLARMKDESGSTWPCYDLRGNQVRKTQIAAGGSTLVMEASYDGARRLSALTYPSGAVVTFHRNGVGNIDGIAAIPAGGSQVNLLTGITHMPFGPVSGFTFGNGRSLQYAYDLNYGVDSVTDSSPTGLSHDLRFDVAGRISGFSERLSGGIPSDRVVEYDGQDRVKALKNGSATVESYIYDATGNRLSKVAGGTTSAYVYPAASHRLSSVAGVSRSYDGTGSTVLIGSLNTGTSLKYDDHGRLREVLVKNKLKAGYRYNGIGQRILKLDAVASANSRQFMYDPEGRLMGEYTMAGAPVKEYVWLDDRVVAVLGAFDGSSYQYVETDHLGTPRAVIHPSKNAIVWRWDLGASAFGDHAANANPDGDGLSYTFNLRLPGQYFDPEAGMSYNYFRNFDPSTGRFLESDPIGMAGGSSTYAYASSSPHNLSDELGLDGIRGLGAGSNSKGRRAAIRAFMRAGSGSIPDFSGIYSRNSEVAREKLKDLNTFAAQDRICTEVWCYRQATPGACTPSQDGWYRQYYVPFAPTVAEINAMADCTCKHFVWMRDDAYQAPRAGLDDWLEIFARQRAGLRGTVRK
jgi:RHS repeat-associated protein